MKRKKVVEYAEDWVDDLLRDYFADTSTSKRKMIQQKSLDQIWFVSEDSILPADIVVEDGDYDAKKVLESFGMKFLGPVEGDEIFQRVELPQGWKKVTIYDTEWSQLVDDKGFRRAFIFYKPTFQRNARMYLCCRYSVNANYFTTFDKKKVVVGEVLCLDAGSRNLIYRTDPIIVNKISSKFSKQAEKLASKWFDQNFPDWRDPSAYWD